jgi:hypothetical protein
MAVPNPSYPLIVGESYTTSVDVTSRPETVAARDGRGPGRSRPRTVAAQDGRGPVASAGVV